MERVFIMEFLQNIIIKIGGFGVIIAGVAWVLRCVVDSFFNSKIEEFKHNLEKENIKFRITYEKLHTERAEVIKETYKKMVSAYDYTRAYVIIFEKPDDKSEDKKRKEADKAYKEFYKFYDENRIFFSESLASDIDKLQEKFWEILVEFEESKRFPNDGRGILGDKHKEVWNKIETDIPPIRKEIEDKFRKTIGIE